MKTLATIACLVLLFATLATAQTYTTVTGSAIVDKNGNLANGTISLKADREFGWTTNCCLGSVPHTATVVNGAFSMANVPDTAHTTPSPCFEATIKDSAGNITFGPDGYRCLKPTTASWSLDAYTASFIASPAGVNIPAYSLASLATLKNLSVGTTVQLLNSDGTCAGSGSAIKALCRWNGTSWDLAATDSATGTVADATTLAKGKVQLAGDLGGTAALPTVPGLANKLNSSAVDTDGTAAANSDSRVASQKAMVTYVGAHAGGAVLNAADATNATQYLIFTPTQGAAAAVRTLSTLSINPSTGAMAFPGAATFAGAQGILSATEGAAPSAPASGDDKLYWEMTNGIASINSSSVKKYMVVPDTGASNNFLTGISAAGAITKTQPAFSNLSGTATAAQLPAASTTLGGVKMAAACAAGNHVASIGAGGELTCAADAGGGGSTLLQAVNGGDGGCTGNACVPSGSDQLIYSFSSVASPGAGKCVRLDGYFDANSIAALIIKIKVGAATAWAANSNSDGGTNTAFYSLICNNVGVQNAQTMYPSVFTHPNGVSAGWSGTFTAAVDWTSAQTINVYQNATAATGNVTWRMTRLETQP